MGLRINTNVASLRAQHALAKSTRNLNKAMTRLSTGLRINTGSDDVVGLAKSESLRTRIRGIEQAKRNIAASSSVLGVAEGYLSELTQLAHSMRELAVQAADDTISGNDRSSLTTKFSSLLAEYDRLANNADFDGVKLLDGNFTDKVVQVGTDEGDTISINISDARSSTIGQIAVYTAETRTATGTADNTSTLDLSDVSSIEIADIMIGSDKFISDGVSNTEADESAIAYVNAINQYTDQTGVTATVLANVQTFTYSNNTGHTLQTTESLVINGVTVKDTSDTTIYDGDDADVANLVSLINAKSSETGVVATQDADNNQLILTASDGRNIDVRVSGGASTISHNVMGMTGGTSNRAAVYRGTFKLHAEDAFTIEGSSGEFTTNATENVALDSNSTLSNTSLSSAQNAGAAMTIIDNVIRQLQSRRASVGSALNRFDTTESELSARLENLSAADSQIREADVASETAKMTQANILQQAGVAVLGQANSAPQIALTLLQNL